MFSKASVLVHIDMTHEELLGCHLVVAKTAVTITSSNIFLMFNETKQAS